MRLLLAVAALFALPAHAQPAAPVQVMVLGTYHFDNPGLDLHNLKAADVTTPERQAELARIAEALLRFRPTVVAVERVAPDLVDPKYAAFTPAELLVNRDERTQIGFRVARLAGLARVAAIDEQNEEGEPDYFPFDKVQAFAKRTGREAELERAMAFGAQAVTRLQAVQARGITPALRLMNMPATIEREQREGYYGGLLRFGAGRDLPGADVLGRWYTRNAKIFGKLMQVAKPGDRVLVVYGAGHNYWLRHFAANTPGYVMVDPLPYLPAE